jgi:hypothetical protein
LFLYLETFHLSPSTCFVISALLTLLLHSIFKGKTGMLPSGALVSRHDAVNALCRLSVKRISFYSMHSSYQKTLFGNVLQQRLASHNESRMSATAPPERRRSRQ